MACWRALRPLPGRPRVTAEGTWTGHLRNPILYPRTELLVANEVMTSEETRVGSLLVSYQQGCLAART